LSPKHASPVDFLGQTAAVDRAPAALAAASRVPLVVAAARRDAAGVQVLYVLDVAWPPPRPTRAWVEDVTRRATVALDAFVRAYPAQWLWLHRRWKPILCRPCSPPIPSSSPAAPSEAA
jgi:KDO2-lipid IV(A) lauroyltransferase